MRIVINNKHGHLAQQSIQRTTNRLADAFAKFGDNVMSAEFTAENVNGSRGGLDKQCRLVIRLRGAGYVVTAVEEATHSKAITRVINSAHRAVKKKLQKRWLRRSPRHASIGFAGQ